MLLLLSSQQCCSAALLLAIVIVAADAVTVVLYTTMVTFAELPEVHGEQYVLAVLAFFTVSLGGLSLGVVFGLVTALITRTTQDVRGE